MLLTRKHNSKKDQIDLILFDLALNKPKIEYIIIL